MKFILLSLLFFVFLFSSITASTYAEDEWHPVTPAELSMKSGIVNPEASAEAIFWESRIIARRPFGQKTYNYIRIKIFTSLGREEFAKVSIPKPLYGKIKDVQARVIQPDGKIEAVDEASIFEQVVAKSKWIKVKQLSFVFPNVEPGSIIEYRYMVDQSRAIFFPLIYNLQKELPVQTLKIRVKPAVNFPYRFELRNAVGTTDPEYKKGEQELVVRNVPARVEEPFMPPNAATEWSANLDFENRNKKKESDELPVMQTWKQFAVTAIRSFRLEAVYEHASEIRDDAQAIVGDAATDTEKVERLYAFCNNEILNISHDKTISQEEKTKLRRKVWKVHPSKSARHSLKEKKAFPIEINELFASLSLALGLEARYVFTGNTRQKPLSRLAPEDNRPRFAGIAVKVDGRWQYHDPSAPYSAPGQLPSYLEDQDALLIDSTSMVWARTPVPDPATSVVSNRAELRLLEDNSLEGRVRTGYTGHLRSLLTDDLLEYPKEDYPSYVLTLVQASLPEAQIKNVRVTGLKNSRELAFEYDIKVPNYATKTSSRLFFQPNIFTFGTTEMFRTIDRRFDIYFDFAWTETDRISIEVPEGFESEGTTIAEPVISEYYGTSNAVSNKSEGRLLKYERESKIGIGGKRHFSVGKYSEIRSLFGEFHNANTASVLFKRTESVP